MSPPRDRDSSDDEDSDERDDGSAFPGEGHPTLKTLTDPHRVFSAAEHGLSFDVRVVHDSDEPWRAVELWTKRSVYWIDDDRRCIAVVSRASGTSDRSSRFVGASLSGGQQRGPDGTSVARPLPMAGMSAVFQVRDTILLTSPVDQVVIQVKVDNIAYTGEDVDWRQIDTLLGSTSKKHR